MYMRTYVGDRAVLQVLPTRKVAGTFFACIYVRTKVTKVFRLLHVHVSLASTTPSINGVPEIALHVHAARAL